jgi:hypothetical protein
LVEIDVEIAIDSALQGVERGTICGQGEKKKTLEIDTRIDVFLKFVRKADLFNCQEEKESPGTREI